MGSAALRNVAGMGMFSVDRSVREYWDQVWSPAALHASHLDRRSNA